MRLRILDSEFEVRAGGIEDRLDVDSALAEGGVVAVHQPQQRIQRRPDLSEGWSL